METGATNESVCSIFLSIVCLILLNGRRITRVSGHECKGLDRVQTLIDDVEGSERSLNQTRGSLKSHERGAVTINLY
jgi:hypothetical protein